MERSEMSESVQSAGVPGASRCSDVATGASKSAMADIMLMAWELKSLLRLLGPAHENLGDFEKQEFVGWLLPVAARMAAEIAALAEDNLDRPRGAVVEVQS